MTQQQIQAQRKKDPVRNYMESGMILSSKYSSFKLAPSTVQFELFAGQEAKAGYPELGYYNTQGKNPLDSQDGRILGLKLGSYGDNFSPVNFAGPNNDYAVLNDLSKFLNQLVIEIRVNKEIVREFIAIEAHEPLPHVFKYQKIGAGITPSNETVSALVSSNNSIENERNIIRIPIDVKNGDSLKIEARLQNGTAGANLENLLIVGRLLTIEKPSKNK